jgi:hypothetical protein
MRRARTDGTRRIILMLALSLISRMPWTAWPLEHTVGLRTDHLQIVMLASGKHPGARSPAGEMDLAAPGNGVASGYSSTTATLR